MAHALLRQLRAGLSGGWRARREVDPDFWRNLGSELRAGRQWPDRAIVLAYALLSGLLVVGFTLLSELATHGFTTLRCLQV